MVGFIWHTEVARGSGLSGSHEVVAFIADRAVRTKRTIFWTLSSHRGFWFAHLPDAAASVQWMDCQQSNHLQREIQRKHFLMTEASVCCQMLSRTLLHGGKKPPCKTVQFSNFV